ncbi:MAG: hypothetical protein HY528_04785 [Chloroflexi bacterium]|nr:hypothetical protein [Chloroflexota bacterium]
MPNIRCVFCGQEILIDSLACPYSGEVACPNCHIEMQVYVTFNSQEATKVQRKYPFYPQADLKEEWQYLTKVETNSFNEAAWDVGNKTYTSAEFMAMRALESVCRRLYEKTTGKEASQGWGKVIDELADTGLFKPYVGIMGYFKDVRNRLAHPDGISSEHEAKSSYMMAVRLVKELPLKDIAVDVTTIDESKRGEALGGNPP